MGSIPGLSETNLLEAAFLAHSNPVFVVGWKSRRILAASESVERVFGWRPEQAESSGQLVIRSQLQFLF